MEDRRPSSRHRFRRRLHSGRRGVAAVVGTLLALLVFLAIFGIFLTDYLPLWMSDNEDSLSVTVSSQFGNIQNTLSKLYINQKTGFAVASPVTTTSASVPVFAQPTVGSLSFSEKTQLYTSVSFKLAGTGQWYRLNLSSIGTLQMNLPNRYYVPLVFSLEDGAVVQVQPGASAIEQSVIFPPSVVANSSGSATSLSLTYLVTYGNSATGSTAGSSATDEVFTSFIGSQAYPGLHNSSTGAGTPVYLNFTTAYACAWAKYWNYTLGGLKGFNGTGGPLQPVPTVATACAGFGSGAITVIHVRFPMVSYFSLAVASFDMEVGSPGMG